MNADEALRFIEDLIRIAQERPLNDLQRSIFRGAWIGKDYKEIHQECPQVGLDHLMRNVGPRLWKQLSRVVSEQIGEKIEVRKESLQGPIERVRDRLKNANQATDDPWVSACSDFKAESFAEDRNEFAQPFQFEWQTQSVNRGQNWGHAPAAAQFQGRSQELETLEQWIEEESCQLVALVGTAGIGKTALSVKLAERLRDRFEWVVWRSLDEAITGHEPPTLPELLTDLLTFLPNSSSADHLNDLIDCLKQHRCLIVLDGFEAVLQSKVLSGDYHPGYENYGDLLKRVGDNHHISCLILTSREKPREIEAREGEKTLVRTQLIPGLMPENVQNLFRVKGTFVASDPDWRLLTHQYDGNPRFLQEVATTITHAFGRDVSRFLSFQKDKAIFVGDIRRSLEQQMNRLSAPEVTLVQALAQHSEPATLNEIQELIPTSIFPHHLLEVLLSLVRRSLLRSSAISYALHPIIAEYLADH